jgi:hypothetical protein
MSERNGKPSTGTGTAEIPVARKVSSPAGSATGETPAASSAPVTAPGGSSAAGALAAPSGAAAVPPEAAPRQAAPAERQAAPADGGLGAIGFGAPAVSEAVDETHLTAPVTVRPAPRMPRRGPLTVMGPWAPVAGGLLGLVIGLIAVLVLGGSAESFEDKLGLVFAVVGLGSLGVAGTLLADEVRMVRQGSREAAVRPAVVEATAGLLNGLTPARLLLLVSAFVLFLSAYVSRG